MVFRVEDDAKQAFGVGAVGLTHLFVWCQQCKGVQVVPQLVSSAVSRLRIFLMYCFGAAESLRLDAVLGKITPL